MAYAEKRPGGWTVRVEVGTNPATGKPVTRRISVDPDADRPFPRKKDALDYGRDLEAQIRAGDWIDPKKGEVTWGSLWPKWLPAAKVDEGTEVFYTSLYTNHVGPRWDTTAIGDTRGAQVDEWLTDLRNGAVETGPPGKRRTRRYSQRTVDAIRKMMRLMLDDAVAEKLIGLNPMRSETRSRMRGKRSNRTQVTVRAKLEVTPSEAMAIAVNMHALAGPVGFLRTVMAAWTGMRPGEQAALAWANSHEGATRPRIRVDDLEGTIREYRRQLTLAPPKGGIGRDVLLPRSLAILLADWHTANPDAKVVLEGPHDDHWRRRQWNERWRPASDGKPAVRRVGRRFEPTGEWVLPPVVPGLEFKGLRRGCNVWLTEDDIPEVVRAHWLGHAMSDDMQAAYSLVSAAMEVRLLAALERRWQDALTPEAWEIISQISPTLAKERAKGLTKKKKGLAPQ